MSISIKVQPQEIQPVYNPIITVLDSTNKGKENYQFIIDINISGVTQSRLKIQPNPDGFGVVDLHKHIEPHISLDYTNTLTDLREVVKATNSFTEYDVTLSEEYIPTIAVTGITIGLVVACSAPHGFATGNTVTILNSDITQYNQS